MFLFLMVISPFQKSLQPPTIKKVISSKILDHFTKNKLIIIFYYFFRTYSHINKFEIPQKVLNQPTLIYSVFQHRVYTNYIEVYKLAVTSIFKVPPFSQKDHNSNEIFVMGAAQCAAPMTKISLLLWSFCAGSQTLKIDVTASLYTSM